MIYQNSSRQLMKRFLFSVHFNNFNVYHSRHISIIAPLLTERRKNGSTKKHHRLEFLPKKYEYKKFLPTTRNELSTFQPITTLLKVKDIKFLFRGFETEKSSSQVEVTTKDIKEKLKAKKDGIVHESEKLLTQKDVGRTRHYWNVIKKEFHHYMNGFKLLFIDVKISTKYAWMIVQGDSLTRREYNQLIRTTSDLFRLLPFSVFIIVPAMELLLPFAIKFFPWMLPSTFETINEREAKMMKTLKVKLDMVKFLNQTLTTMAVEGKGHGSEGAKKFAAFIHKVQKSGDHVTNKEILKFSKLFEDEITLDSLSRPQLVALCRLIEISSIGTNNILRFHIRMKLRRLAADDRIIRNEGVRFLSIEELQQACKERGMRALGTTKEQLLIQLEQWLDLSLDEQIPPSLLLLSRTLYLPEELPTEQTLAATISSLPEQAVERTKVVLDTTEGAIDNESLLKVIKDEEIVIEQENKETELEEQRIKDETKKKQEEVLEEVTIEGEAPEPIKIPKIEETVQAAIDAIKVPIHDPEELRDAAKIVVDSAEEVASNVEEAVEAKITAEDIDHVEEALQMIELEKKKMFIEEKELAELKSEISDYEEDIRDFKMAIKEVPVVDATMKESKAAKRLLSKVNKMVVKMDILMNVLDKEKKTIAEEFPQEDIINIEELVLHLKSVIGTTDSHKLEVIRTVLNQLDADADGEVKAEHVIDVLELLSEEQASLSKKILEEVVEVVSKEDKLEMQILAREALKLPSIRRGYSISSSKSEGAEREENASQTK